MHVPDNQTVVLDLDDWEDSDAEDAGMHPRSLSHFFFHLMRIAADGEMETGEEAHGLLRTPRDFDSKALVRVLILPI